MKVLVTGATGTVGSHLVRELIGRGTEVRALARKMDELRRLPDATEAFAGDMADAETLEGCLDGIDRLFLLTPLSQDETAQGLNMVEAARRAAVPIVYMTVHQLHDLPHIPHFATKIPVANAVRASGLPWTLIEPNNFYQNDLMMAVAIRDHGIYPQPIGSTGVSRVDVRDIAEAAANALLEPGHDGQSYPLVGPEALTGDEVAARYGARLGREVRYGGDDLDAWAAQMKGMLPDWLIHDFAIMYRHFQEKGFAASGDDLFRCQQVLGHEPRGLDRFIDEVFLQAQ